MNLQSIIYKIANIININDNEWPKIISILSPEWNPSFGSSAGEAYEWFHRKYGDDEDAEAIVQAYDDAEKMIKSTGCFRSSKDPAHDPDTMWFECPDKNSFNKLINLFKSSESKIDENDAYAFLWFTWKNSESSEIRHPEKGYPPKHLIKVDEETGDISQITRIFH